MNNLENLPNTIKAKPHWRVQITPAVFKADLIPSLKACWEIMESCRVSLRGWDYPHVHQDRRANGKDWIASAASNIYTEYWRFYQSGQFLHLFSFKEDKSFHELIEMAPGKILGFSREESCTGFLDVTQSLYSFTEIFEFAKRIAVRVPFTDSVNIHIKMEGTQNRVLITTEQFSELHGVYRASEDSLDNEWSASVPDLISRSAELAREATLWFFERFGWMDVPDQPLVERQKELLERRR